MSFALKCSIVDSRENYSIIYLFAFSLLYLVIAFNSFDAFYGLLFDNVNLH